MQITGGVFNGRKIIAPKSLSVRPTLSKTRQSVFNVLNSLIGNFDDKSLYKNRYLLSAKMYCNCHNELYHRKISNNSIYWMSSIYLKNGKKSCISDYIQDDKKITSNVIKKCVEKHDEVVLASLEQASGYLSLGLASVVNLVNPQCIILGGGLINAVDEFFEMTVNKTKCEAMDIAIKKTEFKKAMLGDCSGIIGASLL